MLKGDWPMICFKARCGSFSQHLMRENVKNEKVNFICLISLYL